MTTICQHVSMLAAAPAMYEALEDAADMLHELSLECADCDFGNGPTRKDEDGAVCEGCAPTIEAARRAYAVLAKFSGGSDGDSA